MSTIVKGACNREKRAMIKLYEAYINKLYSFCNILLNDEKKASYAAANIMNELWSKLSSKSISTEEEFKHFLFIRAAKHCRQLIFKRDKVGFNIRKMREYNKVNYVDEDYTEDVSEGIKALQDTLDKVDYHYRYIYILNVVGGLSFEEIANMLNQRIEVIEYSYNLVEIHLSENLESISNGKLNINKVKALLNKAMNIGKFPKKAKNYCIQQIKAYAKKDSNTKKVLIGAVCIIAIIVGITLIYNKNNSSEESTSVTEMEETSEGNETSEENVTYTPEALDSELTYYADIEIENQGTITVKLDQNSAPITSANFVELSEAGFYNGLTFHRIIDGFMMQGGDPNGDGTGGSENNIIGEFSENGYENNLSHTKGAISMARSSENNSASSQFFIVDEDSTHLDGQYAVFGYVTEGLDIVDTICSSAEATDNNGSISKENQPIIKSISIRTE